MERAPLDAATAALGHDRAELFCEGVRHLGWVVNEMVVQPYFADAVDRLADPFRTAALSERVRTSTTPSSPM